MLCCWDIWEAQSYWSRSSGSREAVAFNAPLFPQHQMIFPPQQGESAPNDIPISTRRMHLTKRNILYRSLPMCILTLTWPLPLVETCALVGCRLLRKWWHFWRMKTAALSSPRNNSEHQNKVEHRTSFTISLKILKNHTFPISVYSGICD